MNQFINKLNKVKSKKIILLLLIGLIMYSCDNDKWRRKNFQRLAEIIQKDTITSVVINFSPKVSTDQYGMSLYFPDIKFEPYKADGIEDSILQSLDRFHLKLYDENDNLLTEKEINYQRDGFRGNIFLEAKILELGISGRLSLYNSKSYKIEMTIPPKKFIDKRLETIILGGGQPPDVYP